VVQRHAAIAAVYGLVAIGVWFLLRRPGGDRRAVKPLTVVLGLLALQGVVGGLQWYLKLPTEIVWRQPFPGPGLAIRIVGGEVNRERLDVLREADAILQEEIRAAEMYRRLWQSFCVLPVVRSVGVQGDGRTYAYPIVIRAVTSDDAMTADWARLPYDLLERVSNRIINEIRDVNRVALDISSKPPATIEWE